MLDRNIHKYEIDPTSGKATLMEVKPIRTLMAKGRPNINIQAGRYYFDSGEEIPAEELKSYGLDPEMKDGVPTHLEPSKEVLAELGSNKVDALKNFARDIQKGR